MSLLVPVMINLLALLDAAFAGFRDASGRNPLLFKQRYQLRSMTRGLLFGFGVSFVGGCSLLVGLWAASSPSALYAAYIQAGRAMCIVYGSYAVLVLLSMSIYIIPRPEISSLATVLVLGPFTLARPYVIVAGAAYGVYTSPLLPVVCTILLSAGPLLFIGPIFEALQLNPRSLALQAAEAGLDTSTLADEAGLDTAALSSSQPQTHSPSP